MCFRHKTGKSVSSVFEERFPLIEYDPDIKVDPIPWLVEGAIMGGKINAIFGMEKSGKSRLLCWLLASILTDYERPILSNIGKNAPKRWLYLAGEETAGTVIHRLRDYTSFMDGDGAIGHILPITFIEASGMGLDQKYRRSQLERTIESGEFDGLILEPLRRVHDGDENSNTEMAALHNDLRRWSNSKGMTIILVHHTGKLHEFADMNRIATWSRGCTDLAAIIDVGVFIEEKVRQKNLRSLRLLRAGRFPPLEPLPILDLRDPCEGGEGFKAVLGGSA